MVSLPFVDISGKQYKHMKGFLENKNTTSYSIFALISVRLLFCS